MEWIIALGIAGILLECLYQGYRLWKKYDGSAWYHSYDNVNLFDKETIGRSSW